MVVVLRVGRLCEMGCGHLWVDWVGRKKGGRGEDKEDYCKVMGTMGLFLLRSLGRCLDLQCRALSLVLHCSLPSYCICLISIS